MKLLNVKKIEENIKKEFTHKAVTPLGLICLINSDRFLLASGQKNYFFQQREHLQSEIDRLQTLYYKFHFKKNMYKDKWIESQNESNALIVKYTTQIEEFKRIVSVEKNHISVNTDIDLYQFNKIIMNHESVKKTKKAVLILILILGP